MSGARISTVAVDSPAFRHGLLVGDEILAVNGVPPTDVIEYQTLVDGAVVKLNVRRSDGDFEVLVSKSEGEPLGITVDSAVFDRVRTCDNHCSFCFIYQLPKGMRRSLYVKDDDYRLSFLYGNYTTLTRFTEFDLERVVSENLSPLYVSIHVTDPQRRAELLRNPRGATSLRWLRALLSEEIDVHGQIVLCPGVNDAEVLEQTLSDIFTIYNQLRTLSVVPVGVSDFSSEEQMRPLSTEEALSTVETIERWQRVGIKTLGRALVHASDEVYLIAGLTPPPASDEDLVDLIENGVGLSAAFTTSFLQRSKMNSLGTGFFQSVDGAPAEGYRLPRIRSSQFHLPFLNRVSILTGEYGAQTLRPMLDAAGFTDVDVTVVQNRFFGGNIRVAGLMVSSDINDAISGVDISATRFVLPDVCLSEGRFLDGLTPNDLVAPVEILPTSGFALREYLEKWRTESLKP